MLSAKYLKMIKEILKGFKSPGVKFFIFGSSLTKKRFGDCDVGVMGRIKKEEIRKLKEELADSCLPYSVDVVNFSKVSKEFKENVFSNKILWIKL